MDDDIAAQFARLGAVVPKDIIPAEIEAVEIMAGNHDTFSAWLACETQWRMRQGMGPLVHDGLDYSAVDVVLRRSRLEDPDTVFSELRMMEDAALTAFRETDR